MGKINTLFFLSEKKPHIFLTCSVRFHCSRIEGGRIRTYEVLTVASHCKLKTITFHKLKTGSVIELTF